MSLPVSPACGGETPSRQPLRSEDASQRRGLDESQDPASGGSVFSRNEKLWKIEVERRLLNAFKPLEKVVMRKPSATPTAAYINPPNAAVAYMEPRKAPVRGALVHWLPQEAADWLYQATHYTIPLVQALLGTNKAFDHRGRYLDANGEPASGGQLAAFYGTEMGSRRDRALIAYDTDVDFDAFVTPDFDFAKVWAAATPFLESWDLICKVTIPGKYYRICPKFPFAFNDWKEWCHEARRPGRKRSEVFAHAKVKKKNKRRSACAADWPTFH